MSGIQWECLMANSLGEMEITMLNGKRMGMLNMK